MKQNNLSAIFVYRCSRSDGDTPLVLVMHFKPFGHAPRMEQAIVTATHLDVIILLVLEILLAQELMSKIVKSFHRHNQSPFATLREWGAQHCIQPNSRIRTHLHMRGHNLQVIISVRRFCQLNDADYESALRLHLLRTQLRSNQPHSEEMRRPATNTRIYSDSRMCRHLQC